MSRERQVLPIHTPPGAEQDGGTKESLLDQAAPFVTGAINEHLTELPPTPGLTIAAIVILVDLAFASIMTGYSYFFNCKQKLGMLDSDWDSRERSKSSLQGGINFNPYGDNFKPPTFICGSFARSNETGGVFDVPCLLTDLACGQYKDKRCPDVMLEYNYCDSDIPECSDVADDSLVSVTYMNCPSLFVALGATLGYVTYVQLVVVAICYATYKLCIEKKELAETTEEVQELVMSALGKSTTGDSAEQLTEADGAVELDAAKKVTTAAPAVGGHKTPIVGEVPGGGRNGSATSSAQSTVLKMQQSATAEAAANTDESKGLPATQQGSISTPSDRDVTSQNSNSHNQAPSPKHNTSNATTRMDDKPVIVVFQNMGSNPAMAQAHLYWESSPYAPLGHSDQPVAAQSFPGDQWSINVDGMTVKQFTVASAGHQMFTI